MSEHEQPRIDANEHERKHWDLCHEKVRVFYAVYNELGYGFLEAVYEEALWIAFVEAGFDVSGRSLLLTVSRQNDRSLQADFIVYRSVLIELKAIEAITSHSLRS